MKPTMLGAITALLVTVPALGQTGAHPPVPRNQAHWLDGHNDFYPASAMRVGAQGRVNFTLTIDPRGQVTACRITASSGNADLDKKTCDIMRQYARFDPAVDETGNAVTGEWSSGWKWVLPG